ncbi:FIST C-terminal domain-containing protein [Sulfurospirillum sp. T05]|uniref:FIST C-terminal domain-containing protein n=1 Tax=Sulfurospirillum tamanense TaxID=2813362 RepID=A0ABS2WU91_9BACT|nr:FIST C-terminal domain-containing protein [Sulfurospirillum tamanensis]MBN2965231.1 FIST C-terminal domain-containing protein [Sulfurospirillum tamanensis]
MFVRVDKVETIAQAVACTKTGNQYLVLAGEKFPFEELAGSLCVHWLGAVFPAVFNEDGLSESSAFVCELNSNVTLEWGIQEDVQKKSQSFLVIVDGYDPDVGEKLEMLFETTPAKAVIFGGGAGTLVKGEKAYMYDGDNYAQYGVIVVGSSKKFTAEVKHGYDSMGDFSMISKAVHNVIETIDFQDAFSVYKRAVHKWFDVNVTPENIFETGLAHPLMFERAFGEKSIRIPRETDGRTLKLVGDAMEDTVVSLGVASKKQLLEASKSCACYVAHQRKSKAEPMFVFDCVGRKFLLEEAFIEKIEGMGKCLKEGGMVGMLTLGEIANTSKSYLELYNNSCVAGAY